MIPGAQSWISPRGRSPPRGSPRTRGAAVTAARTCHFVAAAGRGALVTGRATVDRRADANVFLSAAIHADGVLVLNCSAVMKRIDRRRLTAAARHHRQ